MRTGRLILLLLTAALGAPASAQVKATTDVRYYSGEGQHARHVLDIYRPAGKDTHPVVMFVHGGGWKNGSKKLYGMLGRSLARQGLVCVVINYRLSPEVKHPAHARDAARAFAWVKRNIGRHGGQPRNVVLCGHSAGAHLSALLATDRRYLAPHALTPKDIRGVVAISGPYRIPDKRLFDEAFPRTGRKDASPLTHVGRSQPPFLVILATKDPPLLQQTFKELVAALKANSSPVKSLTFERGHIDIIVKAARKSDGVNQAIVGFVRGLTRR